MKILTTKALIVLIAVTLSCTESKQKKDTFKREIKIASQELLEDSVIIELRYMGIMCPCAQWADDESFARFNELIENNESVEKAILYDIKPTDDVLTHPTGLEFKCRFYGRFYKEIQWINWEGGSEPAITLQYYKWEEVEGTADSLSVWKN
jgi:hypothetical protein